MIQLANELGRVVEVATSGDIVRVKQFFKRGTIEALMVSFWELGVVEPMDFITTEALAEAFHGTFDGAVWVETGDINAVYYKTVVDLAPDFMEFGEYAEDVFGGLSGDSAPSYVSIQVKQNVPTRLTRAGFKRIPFTTEAAIVGNNLALGTGVINQIEAFFGDSTVMAVPSNPTNTANMLPIVIGRTNVGTAENPIYELDFAKKQYVTNAQCNKNTHQNSRQT